MKYRKVYTLIVFILICSCKDNRSPYERYKESDALVVIGKRPDPNLEKLKKLSNEDIISTRHLKTDDHLTILLQKKARNGIISIQTKETEAEQDILQNRLAQLLSDYENCGDKDSEFLLLFNGAKCNDLDKLRAIDKYSLKSVSSLGYKSAKLMYGEMAKPNTYMISTNLLYQL